MSYEILHARFAKAKTEKSSVLERLKEGYRYSNPSANVDDYFSDGGLDDRPEVYDDTAVLALQKFANRTQTQLTPSWKTWALLTAGSDVEEDQKAEVNVQLEQVTKVIFEHIHHSNFLSQEHEAFQDLGISTGAMICEEGDGISSSLNFRAVPMIELVVERNSDGKVKTVWREFKLEANRIAELFPKASLNHTISEIIRTKPSTRVELIEGVVYDPKTRMFNHVLLHPSDADQLMDLVLESSPYIVFREFVSPNRALGFGRILQLLPTILKLNSLSYYEDVSVGINAAGAYTVADDGIASADNIRIEPFALIPVESNSSQNPTLQPLNQGTRFDVTDVKIKELQGEIKEAMQSQSFGNIEETPVRTAYEMSVRENDRMQTTHGSYGRMQTEFLDPMLRRVVYVLKQAGKIPDVLINGKEITIKFTSPAARVQDAEDLLALQEFLMYMEGQPPEIVSAKFKIEEVPKYVADRVGLPASMMRNKAEEEKAVGDMQNAATIGQQTATDAGVPDVAPVIGAA